MNSDDFDTSRIPEIIQKSMSGAVILPSNPSQDSIAAATAIYLGLTKLGKNVSLVCDTDPKSDLIAADKIQQELTTSGDNLVISFPYTEGSIDKVDYNIQGETFNLVIAPRSGHQKLDPQKVKYTYSGGTIDFIITIDAPNLNSLGRSFSDNKKEFQGKTIINIDRHLVNDFFGSVNIVNKISSSISELALRFLEEAGCELDKDMSTNLYTGLTSATNNFTSYSVNAQTFETAAKLLRMGAIKKQVKKPELPQVPQSPSFSQKKPFNPPQRDNRNPQNFQPRPTTHSNEKQVKPIENVEYEAEDNENDEPSKNWLKPKIFRGTGLI